MFLSRVLRASSFFVGILIGALGFFMEMFTPYQNTSFRTVIIALVGLVLLAIGEFAIVVIALNEKKMFAQITCKSVLLYAGTALYIGSFVEISRSGVATNSTAICASIGLIFFFSGVFFVSEGLNKKIA